jgi:CheY-like chemotaxis protein/HPt (histidine-containing phosphotransfer) domain-containing protein
LLLVDHHMPRMDGEQLGRAVRHDPRLAGLSMLLLTSGGQRGDAKHFAAEGFTAYLVKPVRADLLRHTLAAVTAAAGIRATPERLLTGRAVVEAPRSLANTALQGRRVLLVEDVLANRKVASSMLQRLGVLVQTAENGLEALEYWSAEPFYLVLMDGQMPVMDGLEATAEIRRREQVAGRHRIPIVALTANALDEDRLRCEAAGMDDFVAKPFDLGDLTAALQRWLGSPAAAAPSALPTPAPLARGPALDTRRLTQMQELMGEDFPELIPAFQESLDSLLAQWPAAYERADAGDLRRLAHGIKSAAANVGAQGLSALAAELEQLAAGGSLDLLSNGIRDLTAESARVLSALSAWNLSPP